MISKLSSFLSLALAFSSLGVVTGLNIQNVSGTQLSKRDSSIYYYGTDVNFVGTCGITINNNVLVAGIDKTRYNENGENHCGQSILILYTDPASGKQLSASATVATTCYGCGPDELVVTPAVFGASSPPTTVTWIWGGGE